MSVSSPRSSGRIKKFACPRSISLRCVCLVWPLCIVSSSMGSAVHSYKCARLLDVSTIEAKDTGMDSAVDSSQTDLSVYNLYEDFNSNPNICGNVPCTARIPDNNRSWDCNNLKCSTLANSMENSKTSSSF